MPASPQAYSISTHSAMLGAHTATRSPLSNRWASARAIRSASVSSSAKVHVRRSSMASMPSMSASMSPLSAAAARSIDPTVVSSTGADSSAGACDSVKVMFSPRSLDVETVVVMSHVPSRRHTASLTRCINQPLG